MPKVIITRACGKCKKVSTKCFFFRNMILNKSYNSYNRRPFRGHQEASSRTGEFLLEQELGKEVDSVADAK